jgi:AraC-like DNA-binding protein
MFMILWSTIFNTLGPFTHLPHLQCISSESRCDSSYHLAGRLRAKETQALFKYTLSGVGEFRDSQKVYRVPPEHGFLCEVGDPEISYYYPPSGTEPWNFVFTTFDGNCAIQWARDLIRQSGPIFHLPQKSGVIEHLCSFGENREQHRVIQSDWGAEFVVTLLLALTRSREAGMTIAAEGGLAGRVQELVANNLDQDLNGKMIADKLKISREHLSRVFRRETGTTLHTFILQQKMDYASHLLKHTENNVKEIAARLGYDSPAHFGRTFRRIKSMTPGDFKAAGKLY